MLAFENYSATVKASTMKLSLDAENSTKSYAMTDLRTHVLKVLHFHFELVLVNLWQRVFP